MVTVLMVKEIQEVATGVLGGDIDIEAGHQVVAPEAGQDIHLQADVKTIKAVGDSANKISAISVQPLAVCFPLFCYALLWSQNGSI